MENDLIKDFESLMKKHNLESFVFYAQEDDDSDEYYSFLQCSNLMMMRIIARRLFQDDGFELTRDYIISEVLRYIDPQRPTDRKNNKGEWEKIPFIPDCLS